jgi:oligopeptide transport system substrate-binding protein
MESMKQSGAERFETLYKADRLLMEEMPGGPLFWGIDDYVISPNIKGIEHLLLGKPYFGNAVIE